MPKPIFLIGLPNYFRNPEQVHEVRAIIQRKFEDYNVLVYNSNTVDFEFRCFYEKDFNEVKFEELKEIVKQLVNK